MSNAKGKSLKSPFVSVRKWGYKNISDSSCWASTDCISILETPAIKTSMTQVAISADSITFVNFEIK